MTQGQTRVLILLLVLLGLEAVVSTPVRQVVSSAAHGKLDLSSLTSTNGAGLPMPAARLFGYSVGGLALIAFAAPAPDAATIFALLLIVLVLVTHGTAYADALRQFGQLGGVLSASGESVARSTKSK